MTTYLKKELDDVLKLSDQLKKQYYEQDIRLAFFDGHFEIIKHYLNFYLLIDSGLLLNNYKFIFDVTEIQKEYLDHHIQGHKNILNNQLIINSWSNFELCITLIADKILSNKQKDDLLNHEFKQIIDIFKNVVLEDNQIAKLDKFKKKHITHTPITNRYNKVLKQISVDYNKYRNLENDRMFLEFFGKLRNSIHTNYIYFGNDYEYKFSNMTFSFINGELIRQSDLRENLIVELTIELRKIFYTIIQSIDFKEEIRDPSFDLIK